MALKFQGGNARPQEFRFNAAPIAAGTKTAIRGIEDTMQSFRRLRDQAKQAGEDGIAAYASASLDRLQTALQAVSDSEFGLRKWIY